MPVVSSTIYLSAYTRDFEAMNIAYVESFPKGMTLPARTCIGGAHLAACFLMPPLD